MKGRNDFKADVGLKIKELRKEAGFTQLEMAIKLGISPVNVSNWERGQAMPDSRFLEGICDLFGVELAFNVKR